jgi:WD40 repeat protein
MDEIDKFNRCIQDLHLTGPRADKKRTEDTKGGLLRDSYHWILDNADFQRWRDDEQSQLLWIRGDPGKGKTMLLCGIIDELGKSSAKAGCLSYFFCQATDSRINSATAVLRGLLYMLVDQQPSLVSHVRKKHDHAGKALFEDANAWVALTEIFASILQDPSLSSICLIIDALDECTTDLSKLLEFVAQQSASSRVKWIVSSRNWSVIEEQLNPAGHRVRLSLELNAESVSTAVNLFIEQKVSQLVQQKRYDDKIRDAVLEHLTSNADNTFLWVALVCQNLEKIPRWNVLKKLNVFPPSLDSLYERMMQQICSSDDADLCKQILASVAIVYRPVTLRELASLVELLEDIPDLASIQEIIGLCGSFLTLREETVYFVHQSAKDFLFAKASSTVFPSGMEDVHFGIVSKSLQAMSRELHRDMYGLGALGYPADQVKQPNPDPLAASRYSCIYWVDHLYDLASKTSASYAAIMQDRGAVDEFLRQKYLYWLEALSLCKSMSKGVASMAKLEALIQACLAQAVQPHSIRANSYQGRTVTPFTELLQDARRFVMSHKGAIEESPLQAYVSAMLFSPVCSPIRRLFKEEEPKWITIKPAMTDKWSACLQTLEGHDSTVNSVAFSHDSTRLASASASADGTIKIWDASNGACLQTIEACNNRIPSMAFSHDSTRLASTSTHSTIKIWDVSSGAYLQAFKGHSSSVWFAAFLHDSTRLASASSDRTVKIWDANGVCLQTLKGHDNVVTSIAFTHDSTRLASASSDETIKIWDASSGACLQTLKGHSSSVWFVAFSHDSTRLASASSESIVKIWDANGVCLQTFKGHDNIINSIAFTHDSTRLASASYDSTVRIWDVSSGVCLQTLKGHSRPVNSVAFTHDSTRLASVSDDETIKIWDASSGGCLQTLEGHISHIHSMAFSHNSTRLASASYDSTIKIWDASSGVCLQTLSIIAVPNSIYFNATGTCLHTDTGLIDVSVSVGSDKTAATIPQRPQYQGRDLKSVGAWIGDKSGDVLWLPSEYRSSCYAVSGNTIGFGVGSGKVWLCSFERNDAL